MVVVEWKVREYEDPIDEEEAYSKLDASLFSLKIHHGGFFTEPPGRCYTNGTYNYVDFVDVDLFSVIELQEMLKSLGYTNKKNKMYYHFKIPNNNLDYGLQALGNDGDVMNLVRYVDKYKLIEVFIEHEYTVLDTYLKSPSKLRIEEIVDVDASAIARKPYKKPGLKVSRLPQLLLEGTSLNDDVEVSRVSVDKGKEKVCESNEEQADKDADNVAECVSETDESVDSDDSQDSDFMVDEENPVNEVDVDMQEFYQNIDKDVEWVGPSDGNAEVPTQMDVEEGYDLDDFDMEIDCGSDAQPSNKRNKGLRALRKESKTKGTHFYVGQEFTDKKEAIALVSSQAVLTRRQLYVWKNDKVRVRAVCRGKCPVFTDSVGPNQSGLGSPSKCILKQVNGKWVKSRVQETCDSGQGINKVDGIRIKVGGKKGQYVYDTITCPWSLQISKDEHTWTVKTYKEQHTCLQTRSVNLLTDKWLSNDIEDIVKPNPNIPVKALREQLQKKYQVGISTGKVKRARAASIMKVKGDFSEQYSILRDYVLELQRTNENTTVKIDLEREYNPSETTRQFKRIYVCIGALKRGFKEGLRDLLGLDGCFMKGQYPGQLLTAVGIDANHGIYPLAYAIVESENTSAWSWFLTCLGDDLELNEMSNFTFISDRQKGLIPALAEVFPNAEHRFCVRHIYENFKAQWKGNHFKELVWKCASATTVQYFDKQMEKLKNLDEGAYDYLKKIPPQHWSRSHFSGRAHCDVLLNNLCEVFNRQLLDGRDVPIITCLEFVREYLMKRIVNVKKVIAKSAGPLTPAATKLFEVIKHKATFYTVLWNGGTKYQASGPYEDQCVVDIMERSCSCRKWELTGMPCKHAVAVINDMAMSNAEVGVPESWVHASYRVSTWSRQYSHTINPLNGKNLWIKHPSPYTIIPPKIAPQIGRPPKNRKKSADEISSQKMSANGKLSRAGKTVTCLKCHRPGHNKRSCNGNVGGSQASAVRESQTSQASRGMGTQAKRGGVSKRTRGNQTGKSSAAKRSKA